MPTQLSDDHTKDDLKKLEGALCARRAAHGGLAGTIIPQQVMNQNHEFVS
jgi:hypothetical protein